MSKMVSFAVNDPLPSWFMNALQEEVSTFTGNLHLRVASSTVIDVQAGAGSAQAGLGIDGAWRYNSATVQRAHPGGAAGLYDIFATASNNNVTGTTDNTIYAFGLDIKAVGSTPTIVAGAVDRYRLIGQLSWDGSAIIDLRPAVDSTRAVDPLRPTATLDTTVPLEAHGASLTQSADLFRLRKVKAGTVQFSVSAAGAVTALGGGAFGGAVNITQDATAAVTLSIRGGGANAPSTISIGRSSGDGALSAAGVAGNWMPGTIPGDVALYTNSGAATLHLGSSTTAAMIKVKGSELGFFGATPAGKPTGVAVTAAAIHAALVTLGLIA